MHIDIKDFLFRYALILLSSLGGLYIFYQIFTPLTLYPVYLFYSLFSSVYLLGNSIIFYSGAQIDIIFSCVAGAAYFLLFVLNLSMPNIKLSKRLKMLAFGFGVFLWLNIWRIILLGHLFLINSSLFEPIHFILWHFMSTIFIVLIWFAEVRIFRVKQIPFYTDFKNLLSNIK